MSGEVRRLAGAAWAFRARVEREAASRFTRLAAAIPAFDPGSPVTGLLRRAAADEDRHAALCAELAATYGAPAGGSPLDASIAPRSFGARDAVLYELVAACCITETESVATLATLLAAAAERRVRRVVHEIAKDEVMHGRMGWAHLAREAAVRDVSFLSSSIPAMLEGSVEDGLFSATEAGADDLLRHGVLPRARKREIFVRTLEEVVLPGLEKLGVSAAPARAWLLSRLGHGGAPASRRDYPETPGTR
ncbi:MAG: ferritin-like domain-containing protein [Myxococcales bacterium]